MGYHTAFQDLPLSDDFMFGQAMRQELPFHRIHTTDIRTQGDLARFIRKTGENSVYAAFAVITEPILREKLVEEERLKTVLRKAVQMNEEIRDGELAVEDIQQMLLEEYDILLEQSGHNARISIVESVTGLRTAGYDGPPGAS